MNFKQITNEQMETAKNKFLAHGKGIVMGKFMQFEDPNAVSAKWHDLINPAKYSEQGIMQKMKSIYVSMNGACPDPLLGNADVFYRFITERDEIVEYTLEDAYLFLRAALVERQSTVEYKEKKAKVAELRDIVERAKTPKQKAKAAEKELAELEKTL